MATKHGADNPVVTAGDEAQPLIPPQVDFNILPTIGILKAQTFGLLPQAIRLLIVISRHFTDSENHLWCREGPFIFLQQFVEMLHAI